MKTTVADLGQRRKLMEVRCQHLRSFDEVGPESVKTMRLQCSKETFRVITMPTMITKIPFGATECATRIGHRDPIIIGNEMNRLYIKI